MLNVAKETVQGPVSVSQVMKVTLTITTEDATGNVKSIPTVRLLLLVLLTNVLIPARELAALERNVMLTITYPHVYALPT